MATADNRVGRLWAATNCWRERSRYRRIRAERDSDHLPLGQRRQGDPPAHHGDSCASFAPRSSRNAWQKPAATPENSMKSTESVAMARKTTEMARHKADGFVKILILLEENGAPGTIRTSDPQIRSSNSTPTHVFSTLRHGTTSRYIFYSSCSKGRTPGLIQKRRPRDFLSGLPRLVGGPD
jgi:hypothetical protein